LAPPAANDGPVVFQTGPRLVPIPAQTAVVEGFGPVEFELAGNALTSAWRAERLSSTLQGVMRSKTADRLRSSDNSPIMLKASNGGLSGTLLIDHIVGTYEEPDFRLASLRFWLVLDRAG
jgi:hypothetical protein